MTFEEIEVGQKFSVGPVRIDREKMTAFAREYDPLPVHCDENYAKTTRYGALLAPGVMTFMSVWSEFIRLGLWNESVICGKSTRIEWFAPVYADDMLRGEAVVTGKTRRNPHNGLVEITVNMYNQDNVLVMNDVTEAIIAG